MRKNTQHGSVPRGAAFRVARSSVAAASAIFVTATGLALSAPASASATAEVPAITSPADSSTINREADFPFAVTAPGYGATVDTHRPIFQGTGQPDSVVRVLENGALIAQASSDAAGTWSVASSVDLSNGPHAVRFDYTGPNGASTTSVNHYFGVNVGASPIPVSVTAPVSGSTVTVAKPVFSGTGETGASIVVKAANGAELATTTVAADGTWTVASNATLANGAVTATVSQSVAGVSAVTTSAVTFRIAIAAQIAAAVVVTSPALGSEVDSASPVFAGTGEPGAVIHVQGSSGKLLAATTVDASGAWSVVSTVELENARYAGTVTQTVPGGATTHAALSYTVYVVPAQKFRVTSPATGALVATNTPVFTGVGTPGATVEIRGNSGRVVASTTVAADGTWSATSQLQLGAGRYVASATHSHIDEPAQAAGIEYTIAQGLVVTSPRIGVDADGPRAVYTGSGQAGATVTIMGSSGRTVASAVVGANGQWTATADFDLATGRYVGTAVQSLDGVNLGSIAMDYYVN